MKEKSSRKKCLEFKSTGFLFAQTPEVPSSKPEVPESGSSSHTDS
jgi:hypothetical protein